MEILIPSKAYCGTLTIAVVLTYTYNSTVVSLIEIDNTNEGEEYIIQEQYAEVNLVWS